MLIRSSSNPVNIMNQTKYKQLYWTCTAWDDMDDFGGFRGLTLARIGGHSAAGDLCRACHVWAWYDCSEILVFDI